MSSGYPAELDCGAAGGLAFPAVWQVADTLAGQRQRRYMSLVLTELVATVSAAILSQGSALLPAEASRFELASGACLAVAISVHVLTHRKGWNRDWFEDRAVAESTQSASWRFMLRIPPFADERVDAEVFATVLERELPRGSAALAARLGGQRDTAFRATASMVQVRQAEWIERAKLYGDLRLADQQRWYAGKARYNAQRERLFWLATLGANVLAGVFLVLHLLKPATNFVSVMTTLTTALIAWSSAKRFRELGESYGALATELGHLQQLVLQAGSEADGAYWAAAAEEMMTHEHWVWVARRVERHVGPPPLRHAGPRDS